MKFIASLFSLIFSLTLFASDVRRWAGDNQVLTEDLLFITEQAQWKKTFLKFDFQESHQNIVSIVCKGNEIVLNVQSSEHEKVSTLYHGIFKLGFLFPHPRIQISPDESSSQKKCGKSFEWRPAYSYRGYHLHTKHPNEWVKGFLEGDSKIAIDFVRWLARNRQNALQLTLLRPKWNKQIESLKEPLALAKAMGISRGISNGAANQQQNHWQFIPLPNAITGIGDEKVLRKNLKKIDRLIDFDYLSMEFGTSEFTAVNYQRALKWMEITSDMARQQGKMLFAKIHVSTNQHDPKWGNFNFLARYASPEIGLFPHTVMFYGLYDEKVPMYGNENFHHMLKFIQEEKHKRSIWYFPETSYWIGMDVDVPLFLTDYLLVRSLDMKNLHQEGIAGHMTFTTGHELGYWLFDWTIALNTDLDQKFDPSSGLKLLGEDLLSWKKMIDFQNHHFKHEQLIAVLSGPNLQDELASNHRIHERNIMKELARFPHLREEEILKLENAIQDWPGTKNIKSQELKLLLDVTFLRMEHALFVRKALRYSFNDPSRIHELENAKLKREQALKIMSQLKARYSRYPEAHLFERDDNLTSYNFNYLWTAGNLHFWEREEAQVRKRIYHPFFRNIYNILDILL